MPSEICYVNLKPFKKERMSRPLYAKAFVLKFIPLNPLSRSTYKNDKSLTPNLLQNTLYSFLRREKVSLTLQENKIPYLLDRRDKKMLYIFTFILFYFLSR